MVEANDTSRSALQNIRSVVLFGALVTVMFFVGLGSWAMVAPLQSASLAPGVLTVESNRKTIQHLEGGIIAQILVSDGDRVEAGQPLLRLDETQPRAMLDQHRARYHAALALEARLIAERDGLESIPFPQELLVASVHDKAAEAMRGENSIFEARRRSLEGQARIFEQRIAQYEREIEGIAGEIDAETTQLKLIGDELSGHERLRKQKLVGTQRLIQLQREQAEITGTRSRHRADIARVKRNIAEERLKILELQTSRVGEAVTELRATQTLLFDLAERIRATADVLARTRIDAPLAGTVVDLQVHTIGGVIGPGERLMEVIPSGKRLMIEARVKPEDIDAVHPGLVAQVVLTAFSRRNVPPVQGTVLSVSADRLTDERSGQPYFLARVAVPQSPYGVDKGLDLYPGMQAEVMIVTGERSALDYLIRPVIRSFDRAMREE